MSTPAKAPNSPFESITDADIIRHVFTFAFKQRIIGQFWLKDKVVQFESCISIMHKNNAYIDLPKKISSEEWDQKLEAAGDGTLFVNMFIEKANIFMKLHIVNRTDRSIQVMKPNEIFKLQRRNSIRIRMSYVKPEFVQIPSLKAVCNEGKFRIIDVSAGGLAFAMPVEHESKLTLGTQVGEVEFKLSITSSFKLKCIIRHFIKIKDEGKRDILKVGLQFVEPDPGQLAILEQFIAQESRNLFSAL